MATPTEEALQAGMGARGADYALFAAQQDPLTTGAARVLSQKTGIDETLSKDLMLFLQKLMGMQNGGAMMAANMQANINRTGVPAMVPGSQYQGTISGNSILSMQASSVMMKDMTGRFFDSRGLPLPGAHGLSMPEMGQVTGHLMAGGGAHRFGPLIQGERMTAARLEELRKQGRDLRRTEGDSSLLDSVAGLKPGDLRFSMTDNADKFKAYLEDGAKVVSSLKEVFGSRAIKDLDAAFQTLFGGGMQEFGARAARIKMAGIKASGNTFFGGNLQDSAAWSAGNASDFAAQAGARLGIDPARAQDMLRLIGAHAGTLTDQTGLIGGRTQILNSAVLANSGIDLRPRGTAEIQREVNANVAGIATEEKAMLALSRFYQSHGNNLSDEEKKRIRGAVSGITGAGTEDALTSARENAAALFQRLSGTSVGSYVGDELNQAKLMGELAGEGAEMFGRGVGGIHRTRSISALSRGYREDEELRRYGLDADQSALYGMAAANLSVDQFSDLQRMMEEGRTSQDLQGFLDRSDVSAALAEGGVDTGKLSLGILGGDVSADQLGLLRGKTNTYANTGGFVGAGDLMKNARDALSQFVARNQSGEGVRETDLITSFMRGIYGESPVRGGQLVAAASKRGMGMEEGLFGFNVDPTTGMIGTSDANLEELAGNKDVWKVLGLKEGDMAGLKEKLKDPGASLQVMDALGGETGAFRIKEGRFEYLTGSAEKGMRDEFTRKADESILKAVSGDSRDISRKEGESDDAYNTRVDRIRNQAVREGIHGGGLDKLVNQAAQGTGDAADKLKAISRSRLTGRNRSALLAAIDKGLKWADEGLSDEGRSEEDKDALRSKMINLGKLRQELTGGQDGRKEDPSNVVMNVQNVTINGVKQQL